jgi:hypothetical protein
LRPSVERRAKQLATVRLCPETASLLGASVRECLLKQRCRRSSDVMENDIGETLAIPALVSAPAVAATMAAA